MTSPRNTPARPNLRKSSADIRLPARCILAGAIRGGYPIVSLAFALLLWLSPSALAHELAVSRSFWLGQENRAPVTTPVAPASGDIRVAAADDPAQSFTVAFPSLEVAEVVTEIGAFTRISIPHAGVSGEPGTPELPVYRKIFHLDPAWNYDSRFMVIEEESHVLRHLDLPTAPLPARRAIPKRPGAREAAQLDMDAQAYVDAPPPDAVRIRELGVVRDRKLVLVEVFPVVYDVRAGRMTWRRRIQVEIVKAGADDAWRQAQFDLMDAGRSVGTESDPPEHEDDVHIAEGTFLLSETHGSPQKRLLVVAADALSPSLDGFIAHKVLRGWNVDRVTVSEAGDTREAIQAHIRARYLLPDLRPSHLLLVGDSDTIPAWPGQGAFTPDTDLYYACMHGPDDWLPDMAYGRLPARTPEQLGNMIDKIMYHETSVSNTLDFVGNAAFAASSDNYSVTEGTHNAVITRHMDPRSYASDKLYSYTYGATRTHVATALNSGLGLMTYSGHAYAHRWRDPVFDIADVHALTNEGMAPFVMSFACDSGSFTTLDESFAEAWMRAGDRSGAVAVFASSEDAYWEEDDVLQRVLYDTIFDDPAAPLGDIVLEAKMRYLAHYGPHPETLQYFEQYHLFGDPTMPLVVLDGAGIDDLAGATRELPEGCVNPGAMVQVSVYVTVADPPPSALILKEKLPSGWTVSDAEWNGSPMAPSLVSGEYRWLFGMGVPVGNGTLTYTTQADGELGDIFTITGTLVYGTTTLATRGDQQVRLSAFIDTDGDGIPDDWEILHFGGPTNAVAHVDYDGDGMTALQEYLADTHPWDDDSYLGIDAINVTGGGIRIDWRGGEAAVQYLESSDDLSISDNWDIRKIIIPPTPVTNTWTDPDPAAPATRFYRLRATR